MTTLTAEQVAAKSAKNRAARCPTLADVVRAGSFSAAFAAKRAKPAKLKRGSEGEELLALQLRASKICGWQREFRFHPTRRWRLDFAFPIQKLGIEIEGGSWSGGRHTRGAGFEADCCKYNALALAGWRVLRFTPAMVKSGRALNDIQQALL